MSSTENFCNDDCKCHEKFKDKRIGRGVVSSGLTHECGVFGAIGTGEWPTHLEVAQIICWGLVALQHRLVKKIIIIYFSYFVQQAVIIKCYFEFVPSAIPF